MKTDIVRHYKIYVDSEEVAAAVSLWADPGPERTAARVECVRAMAAARAVRS